MLFASLVLAALVPMATPVPPADGALSLKPAAELHDWTPSRATTSQHVTAKIVQVTGAQAAGVAVSIGGATAALLPSLALYSMDSGNVAGGAIIAGAGIGYCVGASWAICTAGREITGAEAPRYETAFGAGAGLLLVATAFNTHLVEYTVETVLLASLVPPLTGIAVFEMTKEGPTVRKEIPEQAFVVGAIGVAAAGFAAMRLAHVEPGTRRALVPLVQIRW